MSKDLINVVLDLETLSTKPDAAIIQIGAVVPTFDRKYILSRPYEFEASIRYEHCLAHVQDKIVSQDNETMLWWEKQPTRKEVFSGQLEYAEALDQFATWIRNFDTPVAVWGNGADFDNVILRHSLDYFGFHRLWSYKDNRCFRTLKNLFPLSASHFVDREGYEKSHTALGDARYEARTLDLIAYTYNIKSLM